MSQKSQTLEILLARFGGDLVVPLAEGVKAIPCALQTARNEISAGIFPIPTHKRGGRRFIRVDDIAAYQDRTAPPGEASGGKPRRGASHKAERLEAKRQGYSSVPEYRRALRAQEGGAA